MIHSSSVIDKKAKIGKNVKIGPWAHIEADVVIGDNTTIAANVCIMSGTRIGKNCQIFPENHKHFQQGVSFTQI